jgi:glycerophosphoryl diester phosphodiesterase
MLNGLRFERVAHRGSPREAQENTLPGFLLALRHGADAIELDTHVTGDGVVVVHHDFDAEGHEIAATPWAVLAGLDLGEGLRIPTLAEVLDAVADRAMVYIELKGLAIEDAVIEVARRHGRRFALHSFDHDAIERASRRAPEIPRGVLLDRDVANPASLMQDAVARTGARYVWPHWTLVDEKFMTRAAQLEVHVICWTVNAIEKARRLQTLGVAGICSDDVRLLANL